MDTNAIANRPDVTTISTAPRVTPLPVRVHFSEVMAKTMVRGAEGVIRTLPGGPMMAVALRGGSASMPMTRSGPTAGASAAAPEGPGGASVGGGLGVGGAPGAGDGGIESSLQQSQEMNLYFLQVQEEVNAQNRSFTAISNVLKAEHDTVKTAIGNIR